MAEPHVVILGGGPAGVGGAFRLRKLNRARVTLLEQRDTVGGNAGSFELDGQRLDYGSHRLHPACDKHILADIEAMLGDDLVDRPRHGRILLRGKWIHFPLKPVDLLMRLDRRFALGTLRDMLRRTPSRGAEGGESFASVLRHNLGPTICDHFYFPYARKIWGREPQELSAVQARRRVSAGSFSKLMRKVLSQIPGLRPPGAGRFYYPRNGYGQISEAYAEAAREAGADLLLGWTVKKLQYSEADERWNVVAERRGERRELTADLVWSTLPITIFARMISPKPPDDVLEAGSSISYRGMALIYLQLPVEYFSEFDAHYFPGESVAITRLSEPKNYAGRNEPRGKTTICAELPCSVGDKYWSMSDDALVRLVTDDLQAAGIPLPASPTSTVVKRLHHAYPIYLRGYERHFDVLDNWMEGLPRVLSYGRQGLFAHDNTHHALFMAYCAAECLVDGRMDYSKWREYRKVFETHVVED